MEAVLPLLYLNTEPVQHIQSQFHISPGLQWAGERQIAVPLQQGEDEQQSGDELAGHIPRQAVLAGVQGQTVVPPSTVQGKHAAFRAPADPLPTEQLLVRGEGPLHEAAAAGESGLPLYQQSHGDQKTQRGAALSAVQDGEGSRLGDGVPQTVDPERPGLQLLHQGSQGGKAPAGGLDVLRVRQTGDGADPAAEGGGDQGPVGLGLAGGRGDTPSQPAWKNRHIHGLTSRTWLPAAPAAGPG